MQSEGGLREGLQVKGEKMSIHVNAYESVLPVIHLTLLQHLLSIANYRVQDLLPAEHLSLE